MSRVRLLSCSSALTLVGVLLIFSTPASAGTASQPIDVATGTYWRTSYAASTNLRLVQDVDAFATNPFTSTPARWYNPAAASCYNATGQAVDFFPELGGHCEEIWGATNAYDTDSGPLGTLADVTNPPATTMRVTVKMWRSSDDFGRAWYGLADCPEYEEACDSNAPHADSHTTLVPASSPNPVRNFIGITVSKNPVGDTGFRAQAYVWYDDGTSTAGATTSNQCNQNVACVITAALVGGTLTVTMNDGSTNAISSAQVDATKTVIVNSMLAFYQNGVGLQVQYQMDDMALTYRVAGSWLTALQNVVQGQMTGTEFDLSSGSSARYVCSNCRWQQAAVDVATRTVAVTVSRVLTETDLSSGTFTTLYSFQINVTFTGDRVFTPQLDSASLQITTQDRGGVGVPPPELPPILMPLAPVVAVVAQTCTPWLAFLLLAGFAVALYVRHIKRKGDTPT